MALGANALGPGPARRAAPAASAVAGVSAAPSPALPGTEDGPPGPGSMPGHERYLATDGSDRADGSAAHPWKTLAGAGARLRPGDTLWVHGGTYADGEVDWAWGGTADAPITISAYPGEQPVFDGAGSTHRFLWLHGDAAWLRFRGLEVRGYATRRTGVIVLSDGAHDITLESLTVHGSATGTEQDHLVYLSAPGVHDVTIQGCRLTQAGGAAVHVYHMPAATAVRILDNVIENARWGVLLYSGASDVLVRGNLFTDVRVAVKMERATGVSLIGNTATGTDGIVVVGPPVQAEYVEEGNSWPRPPQLQAPSP